MPKLTHKIIVIGGFMSGKSTLVNALIGQPIYPITEMNNELGSVLMETIGYNQVLTSVDYSQTPYVKIRKFDGKDLNCTLKTYLGGSALKVDPEENEKFFRDIRQIEVGFPSRLCKVGVTIFDSPGLNNSLRCDQITQSAIGDCDIAIMVYRNDTLANLLCPKELTNGKIKVLTVINLFNGRKIDDRLKAFVWKKLVSKDGEEKYFKQNIEAFAEKDIYFIDVYKAVNGVYSSNRSLIAESGLLILEKKINSLIGN